MKDWFVIASKFRIMGSSQWQMFLEHFMECPIRNIKNFQCWTLIGLYKELYLCHWLFISELDFHSSDIKFKFYKMEKDLWNVLVLQEKKRKFVVITFCRNHRIKSDNKLTSKHLSEGNTKKSWFSELCHCICSNPMLLQIWRKVVSNNNLG